MGAGEEAAPDLLRLKTPKYSWLWSHWAEIAISRAYVGHFKILLTIIFIIKTSLMASVFCVLEYKE